MNPQINNLDNIMQNFNITSNNNINKNHKSLKLIFVFEILGKKSFTREVPFNKKLIDVLNEIAKEEPDAKQLVDNIRNDIILCEGEALEYTKTIEEINAKESILDDNSVIVIPNIKTQKI